MTEPNLYATADCNGLPVMVGMRVRVVAVAASVLDRLAPRERERVESMVGEAFAVYEIDEWGGAWVEKWWHKSDDESESHSLGLRPAEMQVAPMPHNKSLDTETQLQAAASPQTAVVRHFHIRRHVAALS